MVEDKPLKSAYELAMERLEKKDREEGIGEGKLLSEKQKKEISRLRQEAKAKLAEIEILHRDRLRKTVVEDPAKAPEVEKAYRRERERVAERLEASIARVKKEGVKS